MGFLYTIRPALELAGLVSRRAPPPPTTAASPYRATLSSNSGSPRNPEREKEGDERESMDLKKRKKNKKMETVGEGKGLEK